MAEGKNEHCHKRIAEARAFIKSVGELEEFSDVRAWAITGSVARGDATAGSDIELVAMVDQERAADQFVFNDELLTVFFRSTRQHERLGFLAEIDAEHFIIIDDKKGEFAKIKERAQAELETLLRLSKDHCQKQLWFVEEQIMHIEAGSFASLLAYHKRAQTILWWAGLKQGLRRVPKMRVHSELFNKEVAALYLASLNLEMNIERLKAELKKQWSNILKYRKGRDEEASTLEFTHTTMHQKWRAGENSEGVVAAREFFSQSVKITPPALQAFELFLFASEGEGSGSLDEKTKRECLKNACTKSTDAQNALFEIVK